MQIVIKIDEKDKQEIDRLLKGKGLLFLSKAQLIKRVVLAVFHGTPLPKGHGRLKDIDEIEWYGCTTELDCPHKDRECKDCDRAECRKTQVDGIPTIIEADGARRMKCRDCKYLEDYGENGLYICNNSNSDNYKEFTGLCCEDDCEDGEEVAKEKEGEAQDLEYSKLDWRYEANQCSECAKEHRQLAEWLKDYKKLLGAIEDIKLEIKEYRYGGEEASETDKDRAEAYNFGLEKALDIVDKHTSGKEDV